MVILGRKIASFNNHLRLSETASFAMKELLRMTCKPPSCVTVGVDEVEWSSNSRLQNPNASQSIMKIESVQNVIFFDSEKPLAYNA